MGSIVNLSVLRELGPVLAGVMLAGRVGGGLRPSGEPCASPSRSTPCGPWAATPIACWSCPGSSPAWLLIPVLVLYTDFMGILGGYVISVNIYGVNASDFWYTAQHTVELYDIFYGPIKSVFFGIAISLICCSTLTAARFWRPALPDGAPYLPLAAVARASSGPR